jgi:ribosomal-protein-alanine N-acetyltransferase
MQEALSLLIPAVMKEISLHRIEAYVQPDNIPSIQLLTRLGFKEEGYLQKYAEIQGNWTDHLLFSLHETTMFQNL